MDFIMLWHFCRLYSDDATEVSVFRSHREIITVDTDENPSKQLTAVKDRAYSASIRRAYDPKSTVKEIAQLVESVPTLKNRCA